MGDEPRRSGRATKGVNNKNQELLEASEAKQLKSKGKGTKAAAATPEDDEIGAIVRCVCGILEDDGGRIMICCDDCTAWQHNDCMGLSEDAADLPEHYFCEQCRPEDHKQLLAAMSRGEKPWEDAARQREEAKRKKPRKGGRKSKSARQSKVGETPKQDDTDEQAGPVDDEGGTAPSPPLVPTNKRKFGSDDPSEPVDTPARVKKAKENPIEEDKQVAGARKSSVTKEAAQASLPVTTGEVTPAARSVTELQNENRKKIAAALKGKIEKQVRELSKSKSYRIPDGHTPGSLGEEMALAVEHALYMNHCHEFQDFGGPYKSQFSSILFNLGQNSSLLLRLLTGKLTADELSRMQSDDMASEELQQKMASMKEEVDKQSILIQDIAHGPRVRRTHKGEELVEDLSSLITTSESIMPPPLPRQESDNFDAAQSAQSPSLGPNLQDTGFDTNAAIRSKLVSVDTTRTGSISTHDRRPSSSFDIQNVWSSVQSPDQEQPRSAFPGPMQRYSESTPQGGPASKHDEEIDRLLDEDANDSPPYSPAEYNGDSNVIWRGLVDMPSAADESVAKFKAVSYHVAGSDLAGRGSFSAIFPTNLVLHGRIDIKRADTYLTSLSSARSTDVTVHSLTTALSDDIAAKDQFDKLFEYFFSRKRYGVVGEKLHRDNVRDIYLVPLEAGLGEMPQFLQRLEFNSIEQPRTRRMLLVVFVLKWDDGPSSAHGTPSHLDGGQFVSPSISGPVVSGQTPVPKAISAMSPIVVSQQQQSIQQSTNASVSYGNLFPGNPYAPAYNPNPTTQPPSASTLHGAELARTILGQLFHCPTAQAIITSHNQHDIPVDSLRNLKQILETYPDTRDDMTSFTSHLNEQNGIGQR